MEQKTLIGVIIAAILLVVIIVVVIKMRKPTNEHYGMDTYSKENKCNNVTGDAVQLYNDSCKLIYPCDYTNYKASFTCNEDTSFKDTIKELYSSSTTGKVPVSVNNKTIMNSQPEKQIIGVLNSNTDGVNSSIFENIYRKIFGYKYKFRKYTDSSQTVYLAQTNSLSHLIDIQGTKYNIIFKVENIIKNNNTFNNSNNSNYDKTYTALCSVLKFSSTTQFNFDGTGTVTSGVHNEYDHQKLVDYINKDTITTNIGKIYLIWHQ
jgi:hypothetical protein